MIFSSFANEALKFAEKPDSPAPEFLDKILVPVDFSECSNNAIRYAVALAVRAHAELRLINVLNMPLRAASMLVDPMEGLAKESAEHLRKQVQEIRAWLEANEFPELKISHVVKTGFTGELITGTAEDWEADLIVMGTQGAGKLEGLLLGSNATHVIRNSKCPVLAVPDEASFKGFNKIVLGTDLEDYDAKAIGQLVEIARLFEATIDLLHVITPGAHFSPSQLDDFKSALRADANYENITVHLYEAQDRSVTDAIEKYAEAYDADMVAMLTEDRGFFSRLFHPSKTKKLTLHTETPVLAIHS